jgi:hypothetical protein
MSDLSQREWDLANRLAQTQKNQQRRACKRAFTQWMSCYHDHIQVMYEKTIDRLEEQSYTHISKGISFLDFAWFVYQNTKTFWCFKDFKKTRPLLA